MVKRKRESIIPHKLTVTDVSLSLAKHVISKGGNLVFSPLYIHVVLGLIAATRDQILAYFKSDSIEELHEVLSQHARLLLSEGVPRMSTANGVWVDRSLTLKPHFKRIVENGYNAVCNHVDFQNQAHKATKTINDWVSKKTNGLIKDILPPGSLNSITSLVFANAIYFKGLWVDKFNTSLTKHHKFFLMNGSSVRVPFMTSGRRQLVRAFDDFKVLTLPYKQGHQDKRSFSMHIFLPHAKDGLPSLVEKFGSKREFINNHLPLKLKTLAKFLVPKFKMDFAFEASKVLKGLGLVLPFLGGGLTEMVDSAEVGNELQVSEVFRKSFIEVNEEVTEAAAVTVSRVRAGCARSKVMEEELDFVADHPFLFVVREAVTGVVIFIGQVTNPNGMWRQHLASAYRRHNLVLPSEPAEEREFLSNFVFKPELSICEREISYSNLSFRSVKEMFDEQEDMKESTKVSHHG